MGVLRKNELAKTILLIAGTAQIWGGLWGFLFPKVFCTFWNQALTVLVNPFPILQTINCTCGLTVVVFESGLLPQGSFISRSILFRMQIYTAFIVPAFIDYQTTDVSVLLLIGTGLLGWAYCDGEGAQLETRARTLMSTDPVAKV